MTVLFFGLCGLDILQSVETVPAEEREQLREWIYAQQVLPDRTGAHTSTICVQYGWLEHEGANSAAFEHMFCVTTFLVLANWTNLSCMSECN